MKRAAIIQNGHIGDILLCLPMAEQLKAQGYRVTWYAVPPYAEVARLSPAVDEVFYSNMLGPGEGDGQLYQRVCLQAELHACAAGFNVIRNPQINPLSQEQYLNNGRPYVPFMYLATDLRPGRPTIRLPSAAVGLDLQGSFEGCGARPRVLLNFATHSSPVNVDWPYWDTVVDSLAQAGLSVAFSGFRWAWGGQSKPYVLKPLRHAAAVPYMACMCDLVLSVSSAPLWSAYTWGVPAICLLPRNGIGNCPEHRIVQKNSLQANGVMRHWNCADVVVAGDGQPVGVAADDLADAVAGCVLRGDDLRGWHAERHGRLL